MSITQIFFIVAGVVVDGNCLQRDAPDAALASSLGVAATRDEGARCDNGKIASENTKF